MKKLFIMAVAIFIVMSGLLLTGFISLFSAGDVRVKDYNDGLDCYVKEDYEKALELFEKTEDAYLQSGNSSYRLAENTGDPNKKVALLEQSVDSYKKGMIENSDDMDMKYNYEFVSKLLKESEQEEKQSENNEQQDNDQNGSQQSEGNQNKDDKNDGQQSEGDQNKDDKNDDQQSDGDQNQDDQNDSQQSDSGQNQDDKNDSQKSDGDRNQDDKNDGQQSEGKQNQDDKNDGQQNDENNHKDDQQDSAGESSGQQNGITQEEIDREAIEQVLKMLEQQEEESLKNNQQVIDYGTSGEHDW